MGDRSNIVIENRYQEVPNRVYLYAHWSGEGIAKSAMHGLNSGRATDPPYLARIVFEHMVRDSAGTETGYGIGSSLGDNEHPILVISDTRDEGTVVYFEDQKTYGADFEAVTKKIPYTEFVTLVESIDGWEDLADSNELYQKLIERMAE